MSATGDDVTSELKEGVQDQTEEMVRRRSRSVESYGYPTKYSFDNDSGRSNATLRLRKEGNSHHFAHVKKKPRFLLDLTVSATDPEEDIATELCEKLYETKTELILRLVQVLGGEKAIELFKETQKLEEAGGMMVRNGTRRRTTGGIYLFLLSRDATIPQKEIKQILKEDRNKYKLYIETLRAKTHQKITELLQHNLTDSEIPSQTRNEAVIQSEQGSNPPPSPVTDASDNTSDTDSDSNAHEDIPMGQIYAHKGHPDGRIGDTIGNTPHPDLPCDLCTIIEKNRREQVAFIQYLLNAS